MQNDPEGQIHRFRTAQSHEWLMRRRHASLAARSRNHGDPLSLPTIHLPCVPDLGVDCGRNDTRRMLWIGSGQRCEFHKCFVEFLVITGDDVVGYLWTTGAIRYND